MMVGAHLGKCAKEPSGSSLVRLVGLLSLKNSEQRLGLAIYESHLWLRSDQVPAIRNTSSIISHDFVVVSGYKEMSTVSI